MSVSLPITTRPRAGFLSYHTDSSTRGKENTRPKNQRHFRGRSFREKPRLDDVRQRWGRWVCQLSRFDSCKTLFRGHGIWEVWGFRSYQECGYCCCICSKRGCGRGGFAYRVNSTFSKLANPMICFLQMGLGGETLLSAFAVDSGCRCSKRGFWLGWMNAGFLQSVCQLR